MASTSLVEEVHELSAQVRAVLSLLPPVFPGPDKTAASFLFELKVLYGILLALQSMGAVIAPVNAKGKRLHFHQSHGKKASASFFEIVYKSIKTHLVHGSEITSTRGQPLAPDLSLQEPQSGMNPTYEHVLAIWDVKLRGRSAQPCQMRISDHEYARFRAFREWLDAPYPHNPGAAQLDSWPAALQVSGLITNGLRQGNVMEVFYGDGLSVVQQFVDPTTPTSPLRSEHLAAAKVKPTKPITLKSTAP